MKPSGSESKTSASNRGTSWFDQEKVIKTASRFCRIRAVVCCTSKSGSVARFMSQTCATDMEKSSYQTLSTRNTETPADNSAGNTCFHLANARRIPVQEKPDGITCAKAASAPFFDEQLRRPAFRKMRFRILCDTVSPLICSKTAQISERCRSF